MPSRYHRAIQRVVGAKKRSDATRRKQENYVKRYPGGNMKALKDLHRKQCPDKPFRVWLRTADLSGRTLCPKAERIRSRA